jgi:hypothetical protein
MTQSFAPQLASVRRRRAFARRRRPNGRLPLALFGFALAAALAATGARAQEANGNATNEANNPLTAKITVNLQDYYTPSFYGPLNSDANSLLFRGLIPMNVGGLPQLLRFTLPYSVNPSPEGYADGLGDLTLFDLFVLPSKPVLLAVGPLFVAPTATDRFTGAGRWQAGAAGAAVAPQSWGLVGSLVTYQHSFADSFGREPTSLLTVQPIVFYNLPQGFYLRSSGIWNFDFENNLGYIPVGLGAGKVTQMGKVTVNAFVEPQYTVYKYGEQVPHWQIYAGLNLQF